MKEFELSYEKRIIRLLDPFLNAFILKWAWNENWHRLFHLPHLHYWDCFFIMLALGAALPVFSLTGWTIKNAK